MLQIKNKRIQQDLKHAKSSYKKLSTTEISTGRKQLFNTFISSKTPSWGALKINSLHRNVFS